MKVTDLEIKGVKLIEPSVFNDDRGFFLESFNTKAFKEHQLPTDFIQDNHSVSRKHVLRGLHYQKKPFAQGKLVRVVSGSALDVVVDIDPISETFGKHVKVLLSAENHKILWVPENCAHGFLSLEDNTIFQYKCTNYYDKESERCIKWNDGHLSIDWGLKNPLVSEKDAIGENFINISF